MLDEPVANPVLMTITAAVIILVKRRFSGANPAQLSFPAWYENATSAVNDYSSTVICAITTAPFFRLP